MKKAENIVNVIAKEINTDPEDATITIDKGKLLLTDEEMGKRVLMEDLLTLIDDNINKLEDIIIPVEDVKPLVTKNLLSRINGIIGEFSTSFKGSSKNRIENIRLSANAISNNLVLPGQEFRITIQLDLDLQKLGIGEANVIIGGELTPDLGGGVCQTSTTLYNAFSCRLNCS